MAIAAPLLALLGAEFALRFAGFGHPTSFFVPQPGAPDRLIDNPDFGRRFFPAGLLRVPPPISFRREKSPGTVRILVFGESAAMGDPKPAYGVARYLEVLLRERHPGTAFEVIPMAMTAINSHALLPMAREGATLGADYWIVYAGNNEMLGPFGAGATMGRSTPPLPLVRLALAAKATRLGQAVEALADRLRQAPSGSRRWAGLRTLAGEHVAEDSPARRRTHAAFERNLQDLVRTGRAAGARVLLATVAVNLRDCAPFGSGHRPGLADADLAEWNRRVDAGRYSLTHGDPAGASAEFEKARALDPSPAALHFLLGTAELTRTNTTRAAEAFGRACDLDTIPLRTDSRLNAVIRRTAEALSVPLVDTAGELGRASAAGIPGGEFFYEHVHLTPDGNEALARAFAAALEAELPASVRSGARSGWIPHEECATRLALTAWNRSAGIELMMRRCLDAPFTNQLNHGEHLEALGTEAALQRRAQTPAAAALARETYARVIERFPEDPHLRRNHAEFLEATGALTQAAAEWRKVIELLPHHPFAYLQAGSLLRRSNQLEDARPLIERAVALQPDWIEAQLELAELLVARGRPREAAAACRTALRLQPDYARAHLRLADALAADRQGPAAVASLEEAVRLDPQLWEARYLLGVEYAVQNRIEAARDQFLEVVRARPDHVRGQFNLGIACARLQRWEEASRHLAEAVRLDPRNAEAQEALAQVARQLRRPAGPPSAGAVPAPAPAP